MDTPEISNCFDAEDIRQRAESFMPEFNRCVADKQAVYDASEKK